VTDARTRRTLTVSSLLSISTDKWEERWRAQHPETRLVFRRDTDLAEERTEVLADLVSGVLDAALVRLSPGEKPATLMAQPLHGITLYDEGMAVLLDKAHPLADETAIAGELIDDLELRPALLPAPIARDALQKTLVAIPVSGLEPFSIACVWLVDRDDDDIQDFVGVLRGRTGHSSRTQAR
jgi:DNA-binding transcriptional LysR family regulator